MAFSLLASPAQAAELHRFHISAKALPDALIDFAVQAEVSIGGDLGACGKSAPALAGRMGVGEGLERLLAGSRCGFEIIDPTTVRIRLRPPPKPPHAAPTPPPPAPIPEQQIPLREVIVTAARRPAQIDRAPYSITALGEIQLSRTGATDIPSLAPQVAGLTITNLGPGRDKIILRGLSDGVFTGATRSTVGLYLDDVPITYSAPDPDLRLVDVDEVEVLRGPQGTLYGAGAIGGIFRIVTRKPDLDDWSGAINVTGSATQGGAPGGAVEGVVNAPIVPGRLAVRAVAYGESDGGYVDDVRLGLKDVNRVQRTGQRLALRLALAPAWTLTAGVNRQSLNSSDTQYYVAGLPPFDRANRLREPHDNDFDQAYVTLEGEGDWGRLKSSTALLHHQINSRYDASAALPLFLPGATAAAPFDDDRHIDLLVSELVLTSPDRGRFRWLAGAFASTGEEVGRSTLTADLAAPLIAYHEDRTDKLGEFALYGEASYALTDQVTLTAGLRGFVSTLRVASRVSQPPLELDSAFNGASRTGGIAPKLVVSYQPYGGLILYAQASEGYRAGGFNTTGIPLAGTEGPSREFEPDELWNYEVGAKLRMLGQRLSVRTAFYYAVWSHIQTDQFLPSGLQFTADVGDGVIKGFEIETAWRASEHLTLRGAALFDDPGITRRRETAFPSQSDAGLPGVPAASASVSAAYRRPLSGDLALLLDGQYAYVGKSHLTFDAQTSSSMGGYGVGRLSAGLEARRWRLTAFLDNPANTAANTFAFGDPFSLREGRQITPLRPRTVGLTLGWNF